MSINLDPLKNLYKGDIEYNSNELLLALVPEYLHKAIMVLGTEDEHLIYTKVMNLFVDTLKALHASRELHKDEWGEFYELVDTIISEGVSKEAMTKYCEFSINLPDDKLLKDYQKEDLMALYRFVKCYKCFIKCLNFDETYFEVYIHCKTRY